jgi:hypothetical protein
MAKIHFFNTTGPCNPEEHYMLSPEERLVGSQLHRYIKDRLYWVLHAPRQTGKTTFLQNWAREINADGEAVACYVSVERCDRVSDTEQAMPAICDAIKEYTKRTQLDIPEVTTDNPNSMLSNILGNWAELVAPKSLVVLFDEVDVLVDDTLVSFLRQLRGGFAERGVGKFPVSIALVGMRDLKDYIIRAKDGKKVNPGSPFNIKEDSATLSNFSKDDIVRLFARRTAETGQQITPEALNYVYDQSKGQPWIVNSLFKRATLQILDAESTETVTVEHIQTAREQMVLARETHLDALAYRLEDPEIRRVIESLMTGEPNPLLAGGEPFRMCLDLGLVTIENGTPVVANPIYREVLARQLTYATQLAVPEIEWRWQKPDGTLDMDNLLHEFQAFWQTNSAEWEEMSGYTEAFPHLLLMAFLQRVINGQGHIEREYAAGRSRMDLAVQYNGKWDIIEIKLQRNGQTFESRKEAGIRQILRYRDSFAPTPRLKDDDVPDCYLVIFNRRADAQQLPWSERLSWDKDGDVTVVGC